MMFLLIALAVLSGYFLHICVAHVRESLQAYAEYNKYMNDLFGTDPKTKWEL